MRAVVVTEHGGPEVLAVQEREAPSPGPDDLLVDVVAAGVNFLDIHQREGRPPYDRPTPVVPGAEGAGVVAGLGAAVRGFAVGDRVAWVSVGQSYAEQTVIPAARAVSVPEGVDLETAAAVLLQGMTAHYLVTSTYPVQPGDTVVVHAAAGGVGLLLTQMARLRAGRVIGTTSSPDKARIASEAGADQVVGYDSFPQAVREATAGEGAAVVYDGVGRTTFDGSLASLRPRGYMALYGASSGPVDKFDLGRLASGGSLFITRPTLGHYIATREELNARSRQLFEWIAQGQLKVRIAGVYPLAEAARAQADLESRRTAGKLVLRPGASG